MLSTSLSQAGDWAKLLSATESDAECNEPYVATIKEGAVYLTSIIVQIGNTSGMCSNVAIAPGQTSDGMAEIIKEATKALKNDGK